MKYVIKYCLFVVGSIICVYALGLEQVFIFISWAIEYVTHGFDKIWSVMSVVGLIISILAYAVAIWRENDYEDYSLPWYIVSIFFLLWSCSSFYWNFAYNDIRCIHSTHVLVVNSNNSKVGVLNKYGNVIVGTEYDAYMLCYETFSGEYDDNYVCILQSGDDYYILNKDNKMLNLKQIVYNGKNRPINNLSNEIPSDNTYGYLLEYYANSQNKYIFFNRFGVIVDNGDDYAIDGYDYLLYLKKGRKWQSYNLESRNPEKEESYQSVPTDYICKSSCMKSLDNSLLFSNEKEIAGSSSSINENNSQQKNTQETQVIVTPVYTPTEHPIRCGVCGGSDACSTCGGSGTSYVGHAHICGACGGTGRCATCMGTGISGYSYY